MKTDILLYDIYHSPLCDIILAGSDHGLAHLHLDTGHGRREFHISPGWGRDPDFFKDIKQQLEEYFKGERREFHITLDLLGTDFQKRVWNQLRNIPYGEVRAYKDIAESIGNIRASRAVGMACGRNPVPLVVPCHRVIGADGKLTGFAHGLEIKEKLIRLEKRF